MKISHYALLTFVALGPIRAGEPVCLNDDPTVQEEGRYLYFDASPGAPFLGRGYYPGGGSPGAVPDGDFEPTHAQGVTGYTDAWIPFAQGRLTDGDPQIGVTGWNGYVSWKAKGRYVGPFLLFDLGRAYPVARVEIELENAVGRRWYSGPGAAQEVWTATELTGEPAYGVAESTSPDLWTRHVFPAPTHTGSQTCEVELDPSHPSRFVLLRLECAQVDSRNAGGIIKEVRFYRGN